MAYGEQLLSALSGMQYKPMDDPYGMAAAGIAQGIPSLNNPYASTGSNMVNTIGAGLLSALLAGFAKNEAQQENADRALVQQQYFKTTDPTERAKLVGEHSYLAPLQSVDFMNQMDISNKVTELEKTKAVTNRLDKEQYEAMTPLEAAREQSVTEAQLKGETDALGYNPQQIDAGDALRKEFVARPEYELFSSVATTKNQLDQALLDKSGKSDPEILKLAATLISPVKAAKGDIEGALAESDSIPSEWMGKLRLATKGQSTLDDTERATLGRIGQRSLAARRSAFEPIYQDYVKQGVARGLAPDFLQGQVPGAILRQGGAVGLSNTIQDPAETPQSYAASLKAQGLDKATAQQKLIEKFGQGALSGF